MSLQIAFKYFRFKYKVCDVMKKLLVIKGPKVRDVGYRLLLFELAESSGLVGFQARNVNGYVN